ncbi:hypothetical protein FOA52_003846 [Chlamydomonas sp. UWO 241]|nr:hypothetical protein FOA52_003846 [Chlamydomonas sp. UWO 241]
MASRAETLVQEKHEVVGHKHKVLAVLPDLWRGLYASRAAALPYAIPPPAPAPKRVRQATPEISTTDKASQSRSRRVDDIWRACANILTKKLCQSKHALPFLQPVEPLKLGIPDYLKVITRPMDLRTIRENLQGGRYKTPMEFREDVRQGGRYRTPMEFREDVRQVWRNCAIFNPPCGPVRVHGDLLSDLWERAWLESNIETAWADVQLRYPPGRPQLPAAPKRVAAAVAGGPPPPSTAHMIPAIAPPDVTPSGAIAGSAAAAAAGGPPGSQRVSGDGASQGGASTAPAPVPVLPPNEPPLGMPDDAANVLIDRRRLALRLAELPGEHMQVVLDLLQANDPGLLFDPNDPSTELELDIDAISPAALAAILHHLEKLACCLPGLHASRQHPEKLRQGSLLPGTPSGVAFLPGQDSAGGVGASHGAAPTPSTGGIPGKGRLLSDGPLAFAASAHTPASTPAPVGAGSTHTPGVGAAAAASTPMHERGVLGMASLTPGGAGGDSAAAGAGAGAAATAGPPAATPAAHDAERPLPNAPSSVSAAASAATLAAAAAAGASVAVGAPPAAEVSAAAVDAAVGSIGSLISPAPTQVSTLLGSTPPPLVAPRPPPPPPIDLGLGGFGGASAASTAHAAPAVAAAAGLVAPPPAQAGGDSSSSAFAAAADAAAALVRTLSTTTPRTPGPTAVYFAAAAAAAAAANWDTPAALQTYQPPPPQRAPGTAAPTAPAAAVGATASHPAAPAAADVATAAAPGSHAAVGPSAVQQQQQQQPPPRTAPPPPYVPRAPMPPLFAPAGAKADTAEAHQGPPPSNGRGAAP